MTKPLWALALAISLGLPSAPAAAASWNYRIGEMAPEFTLTGVDGKPVTLADWRGHYVVLSFMTTWCPYCNASAPHFDKLGKDYADRGVRTAIIDVDESKRTVAKWVGKHGLSCPTLLDDDSKVTLRYAPPPDFVPDLQRDEVMIASFVIVGPDGKIEFLSLNEDVASFDAKLTKLRARLDQLLARK